MPPPDPTWGFVVFVTAYDSASQEHLSQAVENWTQVQKRKLENGFTLPALAAEAWQRFKLDVIENRDVLAGASDDRVRDLFRGMVRAKELTDDEDQFIPPARNQACLVLDAAAITMLAELKFPKELADDQAAFEDKKIKVIDLHWNGPQSTSSGYSGTGQLSINALARFYHLLTSGPESGYMEGMHPLDGVP
ncbi:hypothetical protein QM012_000192 [Aureobasidium pullulans]|uniref:Uncharacterized protein n=1 Tax=Aureobasidium pullulans TaxID=5580 RepID=A0ABR0TVP6_AURPU